MKTNIIIVLGIIFLLQYSSKAQTEQKTLDKENPSVEQLNEGLKTKIGVVARTYSDSVILRWAVSKPTVWKICKEKGFIVERATIAKNGSIGKYTPVTSDVFKPWSQIQWENYLGSKQKNKDTTEVDYDAFAYMFGGSDDSTEVSLSDRDGNELKDIKERKSKAGWSMLFTLLSANSSSNAAEGLGLRWVDHNVKRGEKYAYRVYLAGTSELYIVDTGKVEVTVEPYNPEFARQEVQASENDRSIGLQWKANDNLTFYKVFRSEDNGKTFHKITRLPLFTMRSSGMDDDKSEGYLDSTVVNYKPYIYKVYGTTSFADEVFIGEIKAMGRDRTPVETPIISLPDHISDTKVKITWKMNDQLTNDLKGFNIGRDTSTSGEFKIINKKILAPTDREYIDEAFSKELPNYYVVEAIDTAGNISRSYSAYLVLNDSTPPAKPQWIKGSMDSNGVVTLILKSNTEKDFMGYRIMRANSSEHEFSSVIESFGEDSVDYSRDTVFTDTVSIRTTTRYVYYRAASLDKRYNESLLSDIIAIPRPDVIPPSAPLITDVSVTENSVTLQYVPSSSEDTKAHIIYRKNEGTEKWDSIAVMSKVDSIYLDKKVKQNVIYQYSILAVDSSGLRSELCSSVNARPYYTGIIQGITDLMARYDSTAKSVTLQWKFEEIEPEYFYCIYRSYNGEKIKSYEYVKTKSTRQFKDVKLPTKVGKYTYAIKVFTKDGGESKLSNVAEINIK